MTGWIDERIVDRISAAVGARAGLSVGGVMRARLGRYLARTAERLGTSAEEYAIGTLTDPERLQLLIEELTVQESSFFRDPKQFDALARDVLPRLHRPILIWSCGCAHGQEPYSLAMLLQEGRYRDASVIATDLSEQALADARAGHYSTRALRGLPAARRDRWLEPDGDGWSVRDVVRRRVRFTRHNLATDPPPFRPGECQVIFCRNVLIYFDQGALVAALDRIHRWLPDGGLLLLGHSESLWQVTSSLELVPLGSGFAYRKPGTRVRGGTGTAHGPGPRAGPAGAGPPAAPPSVAPPSAALPPPVAPSPAAGGAMPAGLREVPAMMRRGELAMAAGDTAAAANAFRQAAYLDPAHPVAHFQLGLALESQGAALPAARAYRAARTALRRLDPAARPPELVGYRIEVLIRLIDAKLGGDRR
jgi:chemotaxis protein methyltransferase CheR